MTLVPRTVLPLLLACHAFAAEPPGRHALVGACVVAAPGDTLRDAVVLIEDGLIRALDRRVEIPAGTRVWDQQGRWIYAGLIDARAESALPEAADRTPRGAQHPHPEMRAELAAGNAFLLDDETADSYRELGFTALCLTPARGIFRGSAALVALGEGGGPRNLVRERIHQVVALQRGLPGDDSYPSSLMGAIAFVRQTWLDADHHRRAWSAWERNQERFPRPERNVGLKALTPCLERKLPVAAEATNALNALRAARLAVEAGLDFRLLGSGLEHEHLAEIAALGVPVVVPLDFPPRLRVEEMDADERLAVSLRSLRRWQRAPGNAAALVAAGVPIALTTHGLDAPADLFPALRRALDAGLSDEAALAALTTVPAELCGVADRLGTLRAGANAHLIVTDAPLFDEGSRVEELWIDGRHHWGPGSLEESEDEPVAEGEEESTEPEAARAEAAPPFRSRPPGPIDTPRRALFRDACVWTQGPRGILEHCDVLIEKGRIRRVGPALEAPKGTRVIDATGKHLTPGLIDAHAHIAVEGGVNEGTRSCSAEVRIGDVLNPDAPAIYRQLAGGLTTSHLMHGSANAMGGQNVTIKLRWGADAEGLKFAAVPPTIKFALGENVKQSNWGEQYTTRFPQSRNGVEAFMRERFSAARDYRALAAERKGPGPPPRIDLQLETLDEILRGKRLVHCHSYRQDEILMLLRLAEEFGFQVGCFQHVLEGYKVADEIAAAGVGASTFSDWWAYKFEVKDAIPWNGALMARRGVTVSFNSDSGEMGRRMNLEAAKAVKYGGLSEEQALAFVTINPARQMRVADRVGSIEAGKDADLALWSGSPLSTLSVCEQTWVDGKLYFDAGVDREIQAELAREHGELLALAEAAAEDEESEEGEEDGEDGEDEESVPEAEQVTPVPRLVRPRRDDTLPRLPTDAPRESLALVGATVHTLSGAPLRGATLLIHGSEIAAVGHDFPIPPRARVIDLDGRHIYPGLFDAKTHLGLVEIGAVRASNDVAEVGKIRPQIRAEVGLHPDSELLPVARLNGITHALTRPKGGLISGTSAVIQLEGWTWEEMTLRAPAALHIAFPSVAIDYSQEAETPLDEQRGAVRAAVRELSDAFDQARAYLEARAAAATGNAPLVEQDRRWEALRDALERRIPVLIEADDVPRIKAAVRWATEQELAPVILGGRETWRCADWLAARRVPVLLDGAFRLPAFDWDGHDAVYRSAALLHQAGVPFAVTYAWDSNARNLPYAAAAYAAHGLPHDEALRAITRYPAQILGVGERIGSLAAGNDASLIVTDGDPLDIRTRVERVFISGREVEMESKQTRLWERYRNRPGGRRSIDP